MSQRFSDVEGIGDGNKKNHWWTITLQNKRRAYVAVQLHSAMSFGRVSPGCQISMFPAPKLRTATGLFCGERFWWFLLVSPHMCTKIHANILKRLSFDILNVKRPIFKLFMVIWTFFLFSTCVHFWMFQSVLGAR